MKHLLTILLILLGPMARADVTAKTDFYFPMKLDDYTSILTNHPLEGLEKVVLPNYTFKKPFKTSIINTAFNLSYEAHVKASDKPGKFLFTLDVNSSQFQAEKVITDDVIEKYVGGIYVSVSLKGTCHDVGFQSLTPSTIVGSFDVTAEGATLVARIEDLRVQGMGDWSVNVGSCNGPIGYQKAIEGELKKFSKDQKAVTDMFRSQLQNKLNALILEMTQKVMAERDINVTDKIHMKLSPQGIYLNKDSGQAIVYGALTSVVASLESKIVEVPSVFSEEDEKKFSQSGFVISQDYVAQFSRILFENGYYAHSIASSEISPLKSLLSNRFLQFFLWQDLFNFKLGSIFKFETKAQETPQFESLGSQKGYAWFNLSAKTLTQVQAPRDDKYVPYMALNSQSSSQVWMGVLQGKALIGFKSVEIESQKNWYKSYLEKFKTFGSFSLNFFVSKIVGLISQKRFIFDLPKMEVGETSVLSPKNFQSDQKWLQLVYTPTKDN